MAVVALALVGLALSGPAAAGVPHESSPASLTALEKRIFRETPGLRAAVRAHHRYDTARLLLRWSAPRIPFSRSSSVYWTKSRQLPQIYWTFHDLHGGVLCGGAADFLIKVLSLFGMKSYKLDFGDPSFITHALVAFPVSRHPARYALLDPTFGTTFTVRRTGKVATLDRLIALWQARRLNAVRINRVALRKRWLIDGKQRPGSPKPTRCAQQRPRSGGCGSLASMLPGKITADNGYERALSGVIQLFVTGGLFETTPFGLPHPPRDLLALHTRAQANTPADRFPIHG